MTGWGRRRPGKGSGWKAAEARHPAAARRRPFRLPLGGRGGIIAPVSRSPSMRGDPRPGLTGRARVAAMGGAVILLLLAAEARAQVVLNEVLARNRFSGLDEYGERSDWVELMNLGSAAASLDGWTLTDDPDRPGKWVFPDVSIAAGGFLRVWLSGVDRFIPPPKGVPADPSSPFRADLVAGGDEWRYLLAVPGQAGPPAGWALPGFDDSTWTPGRSGFGYSDDDDFTILPTGTTAIFIRRTFTVADPS